MPYYLVRVEGRDLRTTTDGTPRRLGFFVNRVVRAKTEDAAREAALERVRAETRQRMTPGSLPPRLAVDQLSRISWLDALTLRRQGFVFFPHPTDQATVSDDLPATSWLTYEEARARLASALERDAEAHEDGQDSALGRDFEELDARLPRGEGREWHKVFVALAFWDFWLDARNHDWTPFYQVTRRQWPELARAVAAALRSDEEISNPTVLRLIA